MYYKINTYGCQMNIHESEKLAGILEKQGYESTDNDEIADIIVFNTCCIRDTAEKKIIGNLGALKPLRKKRKNLKIVICGCMSQQEGIATEIYEKFPYVNLIFGTHNLSKFETFLDEIQKGKKHIIHLDEEREKTEDCDEITRTSFPNAWVNIIYGCNNFCSYCIVPYVRGREKSRNKSDILAEIKGLVESGYKEITLLGQNVNSYGKDLAGEGNFADLLQDIDKISGKFRVRFMTSHPKDIDREVLTVMAGSNKICNNLHLPLQSGSNAVLTAMNRHYTKEYYLDIIAYARSIMPDIGITTDLMIGFPSETESDFSDTLNIVREARFSNAFMFVYSKRKGTPAATMTQLSAETKKARISELVKLQNDISAAQSGDYVGKTLEVLCEDVKKGDNYCGRTESNRLVSFKYSENIIGKFIMCRINGTRGSSLYGEVIEVIAD